MCPILNLSPTRCRATCGQVRLQERAVLQVLAASSAMTPSPHPAWVHILTRTATSRASWACPRHPATHTTTTRLTIQASTASILFTVFRGALGPLPSRGPRPNTSRRAWWRCAWKPKSQAASSPGRHDHNSASATSCTDWAKAYYIPDPYAVPDVHIHLNIWLKYFLLTFM